MRALAIGWVVSLAPIATVLAGSCIAHAGNADQARDVYQRHVGCAGIAAAAVTKAKMLSSQSDKERVEANTVLTITRDKALASGKDLGLGRDEIMTAIDRRKDGILKKMNEAKGAAADKEKADLGRVLIECAIVEKLGK